MAVHDMRHGYVFARFENILLESFGSFIDFFEDRFGVSNHSFHRRERENVVKQVSNDVRDQSLPNGRKRLVVDRVLVEWIIVLIGLHDDSIGFKIHSFHE